MSEALPEGDVVFHDYLRVVPDRTPMLPGSSRDPELVSHFYNLADASVFPNQNHAGDG
jgi:hypothetical protein